MSEPWTPERIERLRELWASGLSASQCAAELGGGATRNSVIGKINRLGCQKRDKGALGNAARAAKGPKALRQPPERKRAVKAIVPKPSVEIEAIHAVMDMALAACEPEPIIVEETAPASLRGVTLMELQFTSCRFPIGDPRDESFRYCGEPRESLIENRPYCSHHAGICYDRRSFPLNHRNRSDKHTSWLARNC